MRSNVNDLMKRYTSVIFDECCVPKTDLPIVIEKEFLPTFAGKTIIRVFHDHEQAQISC
jgi:hypothetical protein